MGSSTDRLYDVLHARGIALDPKLPTDDELRDVVDLLHAANEFFFEPMVVSLVRALRNEADHRHEWYKAHPRREGTPWSMSDRQQAVKAEIGHAQIGRLVMFARAVQDAAAEVAENAAKVGVIAEQTMPAFTDGYTGEYPPFRADLDSIPEDSREFEHLRRRYGYDEEAVSRG